MNKMKFFLIILVLLNCSLLVSADENFFFNREFITGMFTVLEINNGSMKYFEDGPNGYKILFEGKYLLSKKDGFSILSIQDKSFVTFYLKDTIILYDLESGEKIIGSDKEGKGVSIEAHLYPFKSIIASSYLTEGKNKFLANNLNDLDIRTPWVEGDEGNGIGVTLIFETASWDPTRIIIFANGYFDPKKLYLYEYNNRIKKVKIKSLDINNQFEIISELEDKPNLQMIILPKETNKIELTILDVYKGTKYNDTCLSGLFTSYWDISDDVKKK